MANNHCMLCLRHEITTGHCMLCLRHDTCPRPRGKNKYDWRRAPLIGLPPPPPPPSSFTLTKPLTVTDALAYKQLKNLRQVHEMFCCRDFYCVGMESYCRHRFVAGAFLILLGSIRFLTMQTGLSKRDIPINYVLKFI